MDCFARGGPEGDGAPGADGEEGFGVWTEGGAGGLGGEWWEVFAGAGWPATKGAIGGEGDEELVTEIPTGGDGARRVADWCACEDWEAAMGAGGGEVACGGGFSGGCVRDLLEEGEGFGAAS